MSNILIARPLPLAAVTTSGGTNSQALLSPNPKEVWVSEIVAAGAAPSATITVDMGRAITADTFYLGWITTDGSGYVDVIASNNADFSSPIAVGSAFAQASDRPERHLLLVAGQVTARYFRFFIHPNVGTATSFNVGVVAVALAFRPTWNYERGSGRVIGDTGTAERMRGGGFAIDEGVTYTGFRWSFGDLQPGEVDPLYNFVRRVGQTKSVLVVEDPDPTPGLNERVHWGLFPKLETFERADPLNTKWAFTIEDWA